MAYGPMPIVDDYTKKIKSTLSEKISFFLSFFIDKYLQSYYFSLLIFGWVQNGSRLFLYEFNFILGGDSNALYNH
jgi:hypothetical protein